MSGGDQPRVLVAGIGNPDRGDDGFGPAVARRLRGRDSSGVRILEGGGDALALIEEWAGFSSVVLVDAVAPITGPGRIHRFDLTDSPLPIAFAPHSSHAFGIAEAVELARNLGRLPRHVIAYFAEGEQFAIGAPLTPAVAAAVAEVTERIIAELSRISAISEAEKDHA